MGAFFGGPDKVNGRLRDVLAAKIDAQRAGDRIVWATYYFCDLDLAKKLMAAHDRGVEVTLVLQERPRYAAANAQIGLIKIGRAVPIKKPRPRGEVLKAYNLRP